MFVCRRSPRAASHSFLFDGAKQDIGVAPRRTNRTTVKRVSAEITFSEGYESYNSARYRAWRAEFEIQLASQPANDPQLSHIARAPVSDRIHATLVLC
jgi:hypothetical protein